MPPFNRKKPAAQLQRAYSFFEMPLLSGGERIRIAKHEWFFEKCIRRLHIPFPTRFSPDRDNEKAESSGDST